MKQSLLIEFMNGLLILLFIYSGSAKLMDFPAFQRAMHNQPFPGWFAAILIYTLPALELGIAVLLMLTKWRKAGLYAFLILMTLFTIYIAAIVFNFFPRLPCSCGELIRSLTWNQHFWFNLAFIVVSAIVLRSENDTAVYYKKVPV